MFEAVSSGENAAESHYAQGNVNMRSIKSASAMLFLACVCALTILGCSGGGVRGEIVGVGANVSLADLTSGNIKNAYYSGTITVLLEKDKKVTAKCPKELLANIKGCPKLDSGEAGGTSAMIDLTMKEHQKVVLVQKEKDKWEVSEIIK
jgi:hypothetical protein